jgi:hypothetical protein
MAVLQEVVQAPSDPEPEGDHEGHHGGGGDSGQQGGPRPPFLGGPGRDQHEEEEGEEGLVADARAEEQTGDGHAGVEPEPGGRGHDDRGDEQRRRPRVRLARVPETAAEVPQREQARGHDRGEGAGVPPGEQREASTGDRQEDDVHDPDAPRVATEDELRQRHRVEGARPLDVPRVGVREAAVADDVGDPGVDALVRREGPQQGLAGEEAHDRGRRQGEDRPGPLPPPPQLGSSSHRGRQP